MRFCHDFIADLMSSTLIINLPTTVWSDLSLLFCSSLSLIYHAPLIIKCSTCTCPNPWKGLDERQPSSTHVDVSNASINPHTVLDLQILRIATNKYPELLTLAKRAYNSNLLHPLPTLASALTSWPYSNHPQRYFICSYSNHSLHCQPVPFLRHLSHSV